MTLLSAARVGLKSPFHWMSPGNVRRRAVGFLKYIFTALNPLGDLIPLEHNGFPVPGASLRDVEWLVIRRYNARLARPHSPRSGNIGIETSGALARSQTFLPPEVRTALDREPLSTSVDSIVDNPPFLLISGCRQVLLAPDGARFTTPAPEFVEKSLPFPRWWR
jgi:hypothetical protein